MTCELVTQRLLRQLPDESPTPEDLEHMIDCETCRSVWGSGSLLAAALSSGRVLEDDCPSDEVLISIVDDSRPAGEELIAHIADCSHCLDSIARISCDLDRLDGAPLERPVAQPRWGVRLALAAGLLLMVTGFTMLWQARQPVLVVPVEDTVLRDATAGNVPVLNEPGDTIGQGSELRFSWSHDSPPVDPTMPPRYRLVIMEFASGSTVLEQVVSSATYTLTAEQRERLATDVRYHWIVEPLDHGGGAPSAPGVFRILP